MARRARTITREDLLHRYANAAGITYPQAHDRASGMGNDALKDRVEQIERHLAPRGERCSFAQAQPTTTVQGQTR